MTGAVAYRGSATVSAGECQRVHRQGQRVGALDSGKHIYRYHYLGRVYTIAERVNIKGRRVVIAQAARR